MGLPRVQLFELEDLAWFPVTIRDLATDYLRFIETRFDLHGPIVPLLRRALQDSSASQVVDLCSGGGGPVKALAEALAADGRSVRFTLTDKYPNLPAFRSLAAEHAGISYIAEPIDATALPAELTGFRTMFNGFHHFDPEAARAVLQSAVAAKQPIAVFEISERTMATIVPLLFTPLFVFLATPFIRPFLWRRLLWTYVLPLVPVTCCWDGVVSQLRAYTIPELEALSSGLGGGYLWTAGRVPIGTTPGHLTHLIGIPAAAAAQHPSASGV